MADDVSLPISYNNFDIVRGRDLSHTYRPLLLDKLRHHCRQHVYGRISIASTFTPGARELTSTYSIFVGGKR